MISHEATCFESTILSQQRGENAFSKRHLDDKSAKIESCRIRSGHLMQTVPQTTPRIPNWFMTPPINITKSFVRLREVTSDVVGLDCGRKNLEYRGILKVNCLNFALMSENEQDGVIEGFKGFLNG